MRRRPRCWWWRRLAGILARSLVWILTCVLARILWRALVLILILRRIGRGNLSILHIGRRSSLAPVSLLAGRRCLLRSLLSRCNQGRSQSNARGQHSGNYPFSRIHY